MYNVLSFFKKLFFSVRDVSWNFLNVSLLLPKTVCSFDTKKKMFFQTKQKTSLTHINLLKTPTMSINLDDSDDDLDLPPPPANGGGGGVAAASNHKDPISLDTDDDDDLPPSSNNNVNAVESLVLSPKGNGAGAAATVDLDDDEDDLPPPTQSKPTPPPSQSVGPAKVSPASPTTTAKAPTPQPGAPKAVAPAGGAAATAAVGDRNRSNTIKRRNISDTSMEAYLFKQSPTWPHTLQKRWVTLKGRLLSYYEEKTSTAPSGTIDLKGAQIIDSPQTKSPHALGITGDTPSLKGRTFIFTASTRDEYLGWLEVLKFVTTEPKNSEIHWFEKMAQGLF